MKISAILPIKHISTRVPGKNYRDFNGSPLFTIILNTLIKCNIFYKIIIDTNSDIVKKIIKNEYYSNENIILYDRPKDLWDGDIAMNVILENVINNLNIDCDIFFQTHTTNPLLSANTITNSINKFIKKEKEGYDSLFSVKKWQTRLYKLKKNNIEAINHNPNELLPTQNLDPLYEENSCIYIFKKSILIKKKHRIGYKPYIFTMNDIESSDIDIETDFIIAECLHKCLIIDKITKNKIILVTGAYGGIGSSICKKFKSNGWHVIGTDIFNNRNNKYIDFYFKADLTNSQDIKNMINTIKKKYNKLDCIINNAASQICKPIWEMDENEWDLIFNCNLKSIYLIVKESLELLKDNNSNIINIGSVHSISTSDKIAAYATSKAAIVGLTRNLAIELSKFNIRVNCVSPGAIDTKMLRDGLQRGHCDEGTSDELITRLGKSHLLGKVGKPMDIANIVNFIADNKNGQFINGTNITIDGGASIKLSTE
jgi:NAD(P)-dependent dehydrogenase (short-subunit alcohol dehydrogenase family)/CMP-N-acetylneuraminic acid synthetase